MTILLGIHSFIRWAILLVALLALVKFIVGWLQRGPYKGMDRGLLAGFSGLMDLQATLGLILLLWGGFTGQGFPLYRIGHGLIMIAAAGVVHMSARWKNADGVTRFRNNVFVMIGSLALILIGILVLPGGLSQ